MKPRTPALALLLTVSWAALAVSCDGGGDDKKADIKKSDAKVVNADKAEAKEGDAKEGAGESAADDGPDKVIPTPAADAKSAGGAPMPVM